MTQAGRPLRFLVGVLGSWTLVRVWLLWPTIDSVPALIHAVVPPVAAATRRPQVTSAADRSRATIKARAPAPAPSSPAPPEAVAAPITRGPLANGRAAVAASSASQPYGTPVPVAPPPAPAGTTPSRFSGSAWLLVRGAGPASTAPAGQLGGSQGGVRLSYAIDGARRLALNARVSSALDGTGREVGLGITWRPTRAPVTLLAEERLPLDGGRAGPAVAAVGGLNPTPVAAGFRLEGYAQAGAVKRGNIQAFADGFVRLTRPVTSGALAIDLGAGAWGGAQPGAARLDLGPSLGLTLPPVDGRRLRLTLDWRQRLAGRARPGSGIAAALGLDF